MASKSTSTQSHTPITQSEFNRHTNNATSVAVAVGVAGFTVAGASMLGRYHDGTAAGHSQLSERRDRIIRAHSTAGLMIGVLGIGTSIAIGALGQWQVRR
jgi:hypothetical protein